MDFFSKAAGFFSKEMEEEEAVLKGISLPASTRAKMSGLFGDSFLKSVFPVRIGRHSGAECLTIDGARNIKILGKRVNGKQEFTYGPHSTTVWLAGDAPKALSNLLPFGWAALEVLNITPGEALWPERIITDKEQNSAPVAAAVIEQPTVVTDTVIWETAILTWSPGNDTLIAKTGEKKAELKLAGGRSIVPVGLHKKLFDKKAAVAAKVTVEKQGNAWRIIAIA